MYRIFHGQIENSCQEIKIKINFLNVLLDTNPELIKNYKEYLKMAINDFLEKLNGVILSDRYIFYKKKGVEYSIINNDIESDDIESVIKLLEEEHKSLFEKPSDGLLPQQVMQPLVQPLVQSQVQPPATSQGLSVLGRFKKILGINKKGGSRQKGIKRSRKFKRKGKTRNKRTRTRRIR